MWRARNDHFPSPPCPGDAGCTTLFRVHNGDTRRNPMRVWRSCAVTQDLKLHLYTCGTMQSGKQRRGERLLTVSSVPAESGNTVKNNRWTSLLHCSRVLSHAHSSRARASRDPESSENWPTVAFLLADPPEVPGLQSHNVVCLLTPHLLPATRKHSIGLPCHCGCSADGADGAGDGKTTTPPGRLVYLHTFLKVSPTASVVALAPAGDALFLLPSSLSVEGSSMEVVLVADHTPAQVQETRLSLSDGCRRYLRGAKDTVHGVAEVGIVSAWCRYTSDRAADVELLLQTAAGQLVGFVPSGWGWVCSGICSFTPLGAAELVDQRDPSTDVDSCLPFPSEGIAASLETQQLSLRGEGSDVSALDCAPTWQFTSRWMHSRRFLDALSSYSSAAELHRVFEASLVSSNQHSSAPLPSAKHARKALGTRVRSGLRVLASCGDNGGVALAAVSTTSSLSSEPCYVLCALPMFSTVDAEGHQPTSRRYATCVYVAFPETGCHIIDVVAIHSEDVVGFLALTRRELSKGSRTAEPLLSGAAFTDGDAAVVELLFISLSGVAMHVVAIPSATGSAVVDSSSLHAFAKRSHTARIAAVSPSTWNEGSGLPRANCWDVLVDGCGDGDAAHGHKRSAATHPRMQLCVALPSASCVVQETLRQANRFQSSTAAHIMHEVRERVTALVAWSLLSGLSFGNGEERETSAPGSSGFNLAPLKVELFESSEGIALPSVISPVPTSASCRGDANDDDYTPLSSTDGDSPVTATAAAGMIFAAVEQLTGQGVPAPESVALNSIVQVFKGIAQAVHMVRGSESLHVDHESGHRANLCLLHRVSCYLGDVVDHLVWRGDVTALVCALSFLVPTPNATNRAARHPLLLANFYKLRALTWPLFDAAFPCVASAVPALADDLLPLCSRALQRTVAAARALLPPPHASSRGDLLALGLDRPYKCEDGDSAVTLARRAQDRGLQHAAGLASVSERELEAVALRLFLERGAKAAVEFLHPFAQLPACGEPVRKLLELYSQQHTRAEEAMRIK